MDSETAPPFPEGFACPLPLPHGEHILLGHGSGGKMSHDLIARLFLPALDNPSLRAGDDAGAVQIHPAGSAESPGGVRLAFSTDSHVVWPLFFPGGDIGSLAVNGTVDDLAVMGARPKYLSCSLIIEEGFPFSDLEKILDSMKREADRAGVS